MGNSDKDNLVLEIKDLVVDYPTDNGNIRAVDKVSLSLKNGEVLGLVGESGCGKSTIGLTILRLLKGGVIRGGDIFFEGNNIVKFTEKRMRELRGTELSMIFQASLNALNPLQKVSNHFRDTLKAHGKWTDKSWDEVLNLIERLEIAKNRINDYPFQFSGGMQQRIVIALCLLLQPKLLIADEPTTALDVLVQARILLLLKQLKEEYDLTMIIISHDLGVVAKISQRVAIMYAGQIVEIGDTKIIFTKPRHPYTEGLIGAMPNVKDKTKSIQKSIPGSPPDLRKIIQGCRFANRCNYKQVICEEKMPELLNLPNFENKEYLVRCLKYGKYQDQFK